MRLPTLSLIIASQAIIWCIAGAAIHGPMILLYPLSWAAIAGAFYAYNKAYPINLPPQTVPSGETWANSRKPSDQTQPEKVTAD